MIRFVFLLALFLAPAVGFTQSPNEVIQGAADELAAGLQGRKEALAEDREALYSLIDSILLPRFDRRYAAQLVLGRNWRNATEAQRNDFIDAFYGSLLRRYAEGVLEFDQERIDILPFRGDESQPRTQVKTIVLLDDGTKVPVNYGMVKRDSGWMIFDVTIEGISYVRNFRTELNAEIGATNLDAVITRLRNDAGSSAAAE